jgi:putative DNA primase/helicase
MRQDPITFLPSHTLIMMTNFLPKVSGDDPAVWRRILVVPFDVVIPVEERDSRLPGKLREPDVSAAVLAWMYRGFLDYQEAGLKPPAAVQGRTAAYRSESDVTGRFIGEALSLDPMARTPFKAIWDAYVTWFRGEAGKDDAPLSKRELGMELGKRGFTAGKSGGVMVYRGVAITPDEQGG